MVKMIRTEREKQEISVSYSKNLIISILIMLFTSICLIVYLYLRLRKGNDIFNNLNMGVLIGYAIIMIFNVIYLAILIALDKNTVVKGEDIKNSLPPEKIVFLLR